MLVLQSPANASAQTDHPSAEAMVDAARATPRRECGAPGEEDAEIVVCGRRNRAEPYRVPEILRERTPGPGGTSWSARSREFDEDMRNEDTVSGLGGALAHQRQWIREWRAERRQIARDKAEQERLVDEAN